MRGAPRGECRPVRRVGSFCNVDALLPYSETCESQILVVAKWCWLTQCVRTICHLFIRDHNEFRIE